MFRKGEAVGVGEGDEWYGCLFRLWLLSLRLPGPATYC